MQHDARPPILSLSLLDGDDASPPGELDEGFATADVTDGFADRMPDLPLVFSLSLVEIDDLPQRIAG